MSSPSSTGNNPDRLLLAVSLGIAWLALVVLVGWHAHIPVAVQVFPGMIPMQYNSALCFLALGAAGIALSRGWSLVVLLSGVAVAAMGVTVVLEYVQGASFGIDTYFFYPWYQTLSADPGRMALTTALAFALTGSTLIVLAVRPGAFAIAGIVSAIPVSLALTSLVGYGFRITYLLPFRLGTQMALLTALAFLVYGIAMLSYAWQQAERGDDGAPRWSAGIGVALLPALLIGAASLFPASSWQVMVLDGLLAVAAVALISLSLYALSAMPVAYKGLALIVGPLIPLLAFVGLVLHVKGQSEGAEALALHSSQVISVSQSLLMEIAEDGSAARVAATAASLRDLVADNPTQEARAIAIQALAATDRRQVLATVLVFAEEEARLSAARHEALSGAWERLTWLLVAGSSGAILLAGILAISFSSGVTGRLLQLRDSVSGLASGGSPRPRLSGGDEIAEVDRVFHDMADTLATVTMREKAVIENSSDAIFVKDLQHRYLMINRAGAEFVGRPPAELIGLCNEDILDAATAQRLRAYDDAIIATGESTTTEFVAVNKAGLSRIYQSTRGPYRDGGGVIRGSLGISRDVTEQRQAQALIKANVLQSAIFNSTNFSSVATDAKGVVQIFNAGAERMLGYTAAEVTNLKSPVDWSDPREMADRAAALSVELHEPIAPDFASLVARASHGGSDLYEMIQIRKDGTSFPALISVTPLRNEAGAIIGYLLIGIDHTARRQVEDERRVYENMLRKKNVALEAASRMKSEFLANMSHELRTPLNAVIGFSEVLKDGLIGTLTEQQRGFVGDIHVSGKHLLELINDILDLSKVEAGEMRLDLEAVAVASLFNSGLAVVREKAAVGRVQLDAYGATEAGVVVGDARKMRQVVYNLLANAVKFTPPGGRVTVHASHVARADVGKMTGPGATRAFPLADSTFQEFLEIRVVDTGIGVKEADLEQLFKPFSQVDSGLARRYEGTGLGLAMVKMLVELHGGTVAVRSVPEQGSCFAVWVPLREAGQVATARVEPEMHTSLPPVQPGGRTALIVEDDMKSADLIRVQLESEGFSVIHALTAEDALVMAAGQPLSLITVDIMLPRMDGWELLGRLKDVVELRGIPVVIISMVADLEKGFSLGAAAVMQKPISRQELAESLSALGLLPMPDGRRLSILIVDDDPKAVELIALRVMDLASTVLKSYGGQEAIEAARRELPDVIVLDLMMPDVTGLDVIEALRLNARTSRIPVIVVTAKQLTEADRLLLTGNAAAIMEKAAFDGDRFLAEVRRATSGRSPAPTT